jgi:hypothetical protein
VFDAAPPVASNRAPNIRASRFTLAVTYHRQHSIAAHIYIGNAFNVVIIIVNDVRQSM